MNALVRGEVEPRALVSPLTKVNKCMKRWDSLVESKKAMNEQHGLASGTISSNREELERCGCWLRRRKPKPRLEEVDGQLLVKYLKGRNGFPGTP